MQPSGRDSPSPSAISDYIRKAIARKTGSKSSSTSEYVSSSRLETNPSADCAQISSKYVTNVSSQLETGNSPASAPLALPEAETFAVDNEREEAKQPVPHAEVVEKSGLEQDPATKSPVASARLDARRAELVRAVNQITRRTVRNVAATIKPPQAVVNIVIAYVSVLRLVQRGKKHAVDEGWIMSEEKPKTYLNCVEALGKDELVHQVTYEIVRHLDDATKEELARVRRLREKYLAGWDMRPAAFSDRHYSARTLLHFLLTLVSYVDVLYPISVPTCRWSMSTTDEPWRQKRREK